MLVICLASPAAHAQSTCASGQASAILDVANVRARLFNNGNFFWNGTGNTYNVPKAPKGEPWVPNAFFAAGVWFGGRTSSDELRTSAAQYANKELWPGPLDADGNPPSDCTPYDHIFKVSDDDIRAFERDGTLSDDLRDWPFDLGAPVIDGDGVPGNYSLDGGDRPEVWGDQMLWWVMNDAGNEHPTTGTPPMGLEVQVSAFAADSATTFSNVNEAVANATFYRFRLINKSPEPLHDVWFGWWTDGDLGNATDDYVGTDTTLRMGYYYNADNLDENGYGSAPAALGFLLPQGPLVDDDGLDNDHDGATDELNERLQFTRSLWYRSTGGPDGFPATAEDYYHYLQGLWQDGSPQCTNGTGWQDTPCDETTPFALPGDPVTGEAWSLVNTDGQGTPFPSNDQVFLISSGPFTMNPGETQDLVMAIVWARGKDNLDSVTELRTAAGYVETALPDLMQYQVATAIDPGPDAKDVYAMRANYPEPFTERTTIRYEIARAEHVRLAVYDVLGREVARLVDAEQPANVYDVTFEAESLPAGVYFYRLVTRTVVITRRMAKVR